uniref:Monooxygenase n=2 Tax=Kwoniella pini CBS 10737 TaxID=1296096 RepID=A0A1B9I296_9TREE|nr:monooxygenase [Kwoniella pini CBS 10737]OCF49571.1 monooxygenase [Kwoniella pini CBS 10737]
MMSAPQPIVIIGAGPSGLLLAKYLEQNEIPVVIYEGDPHANHRPQGGSLDLHDDTGLLALRQTYLLDEASKMMRAEGEAMKVVDKTGKIWLDENVPEEEQQVDTKRVDVGEIRGRPEIDRTDLRNLLIKSLSPKTIQWDHKITSVTALSTSLYEIRFIDKPTITTPYLIGADGAFSLVRPLLHDIKPDYSGCSMYELEILPSNLTSSLETYIGKGALMILDEGKALMPQMNSGKKCKIYLALKVPFNWQKENPLPEKGKREWLVNLFEGWLPQAKEIIMASEETSINQRKIYQFDPELTWNTDKTGVTVMGDAAHVMSPFAGEGVNQALADALLLGQTLVPLFRPKLELGKSSSPPFPLSFFPISQPTERPTPLVEPSTDDLHEALREFEIKMMKRAKVEMEGSKENMDMFFGDEPARHLAGMLKFYGRIGYLMEMLTWPIEKVKGLFR